MGQQMSQQDERIDTYIAMSAGFAQPILKHLRNLVHQGCPEVEETLKWSMPAFVYKGLLCSMAAFKRHATFGFWKHELILSETLDKKAMGQFGRITSLADLPTNQVMLKYIRKAAELNEAGTKVPSRTRANHAAKRRLVMPRYLVSGLEKNQRARANFEKLSYSHKKEYVEWLASAKREETRQKRLKTALAWIAQSKPQNWRHMRSHT